MSELTLHDTLSNRLQDQKTQEKLGRFLDKLDTLNEVLDKVGHLTAQGPGLVSMAADAADETYADLRKRGIDVEQRTARLLGLVEKLTEPERLEQIEKLLALSEQMPGMISMFADMTDDACRQAESNGIQIDQRIQNALRLAEKFTDPETSRKVDQLLDLTDQLPGLSAMAGDVIDEEMQDRSSPFAGAVFLMQEMGGALGEASCERRRRPGIFTLFRRLRHPYVRRSLCFLMSFAERLGERLEKRSPLYYRNIKDATFENQE